MTNFDEKLIDLIYKYPHLWNIRLSDFKDIGKKKNSWTEIAQILESDASTCEKRWDSLRTYYSRERKAQLLPTGSGFTNRKKFEFYDQMSFIADFVKTRKTTSNIALDDSQEELEDGPTERNDGDSEKSAESSAVKMAFIEDTIPPKKIRPHQAKEIHLQKDQQELLLLKTLVEKSSEPNNPKPNEEELFGQSVGEALQRLPVATRTRTKIRILQVIESAEQDMVGGGVINTPVQPLYQGIQGYNFVNQ